MLLHRIEGPFDLIAEGSDRMLGGLGMLDQFRYIEVIIGCLRFDSDLI
jgi:hypothetical protein